VPITGKVFDTLVFLIERRDRVVSKDEILTGVWPDANVEEANLAQSISVLRRSLGEKPGENKYIVTVAGRGYQFAADIEEPTIGERKPRRPRSPRAVALIGGTIAALAMLALVSWVRTPGQSIPATVRVTSLPGVETQPSFSPDGKQIVFVWGGETGENEDIYVSLVGTDSILRLTTDPASDTSPAWSPDGKYIAFYRAGAQPGCFIVPAIGGTERKITDVEPRGKSVGRKVVWSPDGKLLYLSEPPKPQTVPRIVAVSFATGEKRSVTHSGEQLGDEDMAISPDGSQLAFVRGFVRLCVLRLDGAQERSLVMAPGIRGLAWTTDGKSIVYATLRSSGNNLWKIAASGSARPELISGVSGEVAFPAISPDGRKLVYSESRVNTNIWRLDLRGDAARAGSPASDERLIYSTKSQHSPQLSPDGRRIVFGSDRSGTREIWVCEQDGRNARQLTFYGGPHTGTPRWSPDGRSIAYDSYVGNSPDIHVIAAEGGTAQNVTNHPASDVTPSYSRDGRWIYFSSNRSGTFQIWRMPTGGGEAVQITRNGGGIPIESYDGRFIYYSKFTQFRPGLFRIPTGGGEETLVIQGVGSWGWWAISEAGIYFIEQSRPEDAAKLQLLSFSGTVQTIRALRTPPSDAENVLGVDRSGRTVLLEQIDERFGDLVMVQGFR
jgi:Tol biopolymer transport system component